MAITLFGLPLAYGVAHDAMGTERQRLIQSATSVASLVAEELDEGRTPARPAPPAPDVQIAVYDAERDRVLGSGPNTIDREVEQAFEGQVNSWRRDGQIMVAVPVATNDHLVGVIRASRPLGTVYQRVGLIWAGMFGLATIALAAVWLLARRQAGKLAAPLENLADGANRLGDGDFSVRITRTAIPEIDAVGQAMNTTAGRLDEMLARERAFSAEASHQLRTPLAGLRLRLEAALHTPGKDPYAALADGIADADRVEQTVEELLALARRRGRGSGEPLDLPTLLAEAERDWRHRPGAESRSLQVVQLPELPGSPASTAAVRQVLTVLLDNAVTHGAGTVSVIARDTGAALAIDVSDEGPGVALSEAELFARRNPHDPEDAGHGRRTRGHGIGLALARRLAEAEGGRLRLACPLPTTFTILLPTTR
ncbi:MAG: ATP-binding protein [Pseudonocardia sp.]